MQFARLSLGLVAALLCSCPDTSSGPRAGATQNEFEPISSFGTGGLEITNASTARPYYHDFGTVLYGERLRHTFELINREKRALTIKDMLPSCGCTTPRVSYIAADGERVTGSNERGQEVITIPPGAKVEIEVAVDTTLVETPNLDKLSQVRVRTDSDTNPYITLELHLKVIRAFRAVPGKLDLGATPQSAGKSARTDISVCVKGNRSLIRSITHVEGPFTADLQESVAQGEKFWILTATAAPGLPLGPVKGSVTLSTTRDDGEGEGAAFSVPILAQIVNDIVVNPGVLQLVNVDRARGAEMRAELLVLVPGGKIRVLAARLEGTASGELELIANPIDPDDEGRARVHEIVFKAGAALNTADFRGLAVFETDDPNMPRVTVPYAGTSR
ncbi:MAG: DUF1573 domain-containing protein [Planctomycetes bacterium]|nr:DUF1573 domain-containing protein [Planctomycetota bacterium]